jgi:hypothetical protein
MRKFIWALAPLAIVVASVTAQAAGWGDLSGTFVLSGDAPKPMPITPNKDVEVCGKHKLVDESLVIGANKGIKNIVVYLYLKEGEKAPAAHKDYEASAKAEVILDNDKCRFEPHIALLRTTQTLLVGNKDSVGHNTKIECIDNTSVNPLVPAGANLKLPFPKPERLPSTVSCSIHPWMTAKVLIRDNPYFAVTDENGKFTIKNLPEGKFTFQFWHEQSGFLAKELKKDGKALTWAKGRTEVAITPKGVDLGKVEVGVGAFKK